VDGGKGDQQVAQSIADVDIVRLLEDSPHNGNQHAKRVTMATDGVR
jgi:hypothetical protein